MEGAELAEYLEQLRLGEERKGSGSKSDDDSGSDSDASDADADHVMDRDEYFISEKAGELDMSNGDRSQISQVRVASAFPMYACVEENSTWGDYGEAVDPNAFEVNLDDEEQDAIEEEKVGFLCP
jgi:hypothetical protein